MSVDQQQLVSVMLPRPVTGPRPRVPPIDLAPRVLFAGPQPGSAIVRRDVPEVRPHARLTGFKRQLFSVERQSVSVMLGNDVADRVLLVPPIL